MSVGPDFRKRAGRVQKRVVVGNGSVSIYPQNFSLVGAQLLGSIVSGLRDAHEQCLVGEEYHSRADIYVTAHIIACAKDTHNVRQTGSGISRAIYRSMMRIDRAF